LNAQTAPPKNRAKSSHQASSAQNAAQQNAAEAKFSRLAAELDATLQSAARRASSSSVAAWLSSPGSARAVINLTHDAVIIRNSANVVEAWNIAAEQLYGWTTQEAIGKVIHSLLDTKFPESLTAVEKALVDNGYWEAELQHRRKDGKRITVLSRQSLLRASSGAPLLIKEINRDVTQERRQLGYLRLLNEVGEAVIEAQSASEALRWCLASICVHAGWRFGRAMAFASESPAERPTLVSWFIGDEQRFGPVRAALEETSQLAESALSGRTLQSKQAIWVPDLSVDPYFKRIPEIASAGLVCAFAQPILIGTGASAVIVLYSDSPSEPDEAFLSTMNSVASHLRRFFERLAAEEAQRQLSISLMRAQDDERRRIARELHDSAGQYLGALGLAIEATRRCAPELPAVATEKLDEAGKIIERCSAELRTLSHLLHPPLLEDLGLSSALNWYIDGFTDRSGIRVSAQVPTLPRFDHAAELTLFRVLQECLTNIHRHSGSKTATVKVEASERSLTIEISDQGKGIPASTLRGWFRNTQRSGVGISGMRERLNDLGGTFEINSTEKGTTVRATIPLREEAALAGSAASAGDNGAATRAAAAVTAGAGNDGAASHADGIAKPGNGGATQTELAFASNTNSLRAPASQKTKPASV
jgi:PAS domain S-box-containing protein